MLSCRPQQARERRGQRRQHRLVRAEERHGLLVDAILRVRRLHQPGHDDLGRVVADRQVVREVLADLIAVLGGLHRAQLLVARRARASRARRDRRRTPSRRPRRRSSSFACAACSSASAVFSTCSASTSDSFSAPRKSRYACRMSCSRSIWSFESFDDVEIDLLDLVEAARDVAARGLLPDVREALERVDAAVLDLLDHALRVVANAVEAVRDLRVALAELHRRDLLAHDLVEQRRLARACARSRRPCRCRDRRRGSGARRSAPPRSSRARGRDRGAASSLCRDIGSELPWPASFELVSNCGTAGRRRVHARYPPIVRGRTPSLLQLACQRPQVLVTA